MATLKEINTAKQEQQVMQNFVEANAAVIRKIGETLSSKSKKTGEALLDNFRKTYK